ncbi:PilW family protein [Paracidovorax citrulli]
MTRSAPRPRAMAGVSLVEMMIALVIGMIIMLGVIQVFAASQTASRLSEGASRVQENARFATEFLERDLRMAGHMGCVNDQAHVVKNLGDPVNHLVAGVGSGSPLDFRVSIQGYEAPNTAPGGVLTLGAAWTAPSGLPASISGLNPAPAGGSDVLVLRFLGAEGVPVNQISLAGGASTVTGDADRITRMTKDGVGTPTLFGIADCGHADIFAGALSGNEVKATGVDLTRYTTQPTGQTMLYRAESLVYYIGRNATTGVNGLRRARADSSGAYSTNEEVVEGIENLQLMFGLDSTPVIGLATPPVGSVTQAAVASGVTTATDAAGAGQWLRVGQVKVGLLAVSPDRSSSIDAVNRPSVLGVEFAPAANNDGRYRSAYEVSVALRNRLFGN